MKKLLWAFLYCFIIKTVYSQKTPTLHIGKDQLALATLDVSVNITGNIATTTYDMSFYNPSNRVLEGQLKFPLAENQEVSRLALEMNGKLREAVVVEKELGRIAFEGIVRRGVDPALLEKGKGNSYNIRVYPIPAKGYKRVVIAYEQELLYKEKAHYYHLPLGFKDKLDRFTVNIEALNQKSKPIIVEGEGTMAFTNWQNSFKTSLQKENYIPNKSISVKIPIALKEEKLIVSPDYFYFYKTLNPAIRKRKKPSKISFLWDVSLSMKGRDLEKEINLLDTYFKQLKNVDIDFTSFSNVIVNQQKIKIRNGDWSVLKNLLLNTVYDGATSFTAIENLKTKADIVLLSSDGLTTLSISRFVKDIPVFTINSKTESAHKDLFKIARKTKGGYINLNTNTIKEAIASLTDVPFEYLGYSSYTKQIEVYTSKSSKGLLDFSVAGKNYNPNEKIVFFFGYGDDITLKIPVTLTTKNSVNNTQINRIWAKNKLNKLLEDKEQNKEFIIDLATTHSLVTDYTSLIVLEDIRDYIKYNITPPEELLAEYNRIKNGSDKNLAPTINANSSPEIENESANIPQKINADDKSSLPPPPPPAPERIEVVEDEKMVKERIIESVEADRIQEVLEEETVDNYTPTPAASPIANNRNESSKRVYNKYTGSLVIADRIPKTPYLNGLGFFDKEEDAYKFYLKQRESYKEVTHYYIDVSDYFYKKFNSKIYAARILSNIAELDGDNYEQQRAYAYKLEERNEKELAVFIYKNILELRPEDSQSYRDLALAYENTGLCQEAYDILADIVTEEIYKNNKHRRVFKGIQDIASEELNLLYKKYSSDLDESKLIKEHHKKEESSDLRIIVDWNHNDTDIDLHIIDPNLEECSYKHKNTQIGGHISQDMTQGFGPEQFILKKAIKGSYYIKVNYYGDGKQRIETPTFMKVTIFKNQGKSNEEKTIRVIRLTRQDNQQILTKVTF